MAAKAQGQKWSCSVWIPWNLCLLSTSFGVRALGFKEWTDCHCGFIWNIFKFLGCCCCTVCLGETSKLQIVLKIQRQLLLTSPWPLWVLAMVNSVTHAGKRQGKESKGGVLSCGVDIPVTALSYKTSVLERHWNVLWSTFNHLELPWDEVRRLLPLDVIAHSLLVGRCTVIIKNWIQSLILSVWSWLRPLTLGQDRRQGGW